MDYIKKIKNHLIDNSYFWFVFLPFTALAFVIIMLIMCYPGAASSGVKNGIETCLNILLPSLFPFMFFSSLINNLGFFDFSGKITGRLTRFVFGLPGESLPIIIMSLIGGFPVGAYLVKDAFERGKLTSLEGKRMLLFCVNPGVAFSFSMLGDTLYSSVQIGCIVYAVSVISSIILGVLSHFYEDGGEHRKNSVDNSERPPVSETVIDTMNNCIRSTVNVCVWVIMFSCIAALVDILPFEKNTSEFIKMIGEVTNGVIVAKSSYSFPVLCAVVGFGGFCIHMQVMPALTALKLRYKHFLCSRVICCALNCVLSYILLRLFPLQKEAAMFFEKPQKAYIYSSAPLCVFLMIMCGLFVLGDGYTVWKKEKIYRQKQVISRNYIDFFR